MVRFQMTLARQSRWDKHNQLQHIHATNEDFAQLSPGRIFTMSHEVEGLYYAGMLG